VIHKESDDRGNLSVRRVLCEVPAVPAASRAGIARRAAENLTLATDWSWPNSSLPVGLTEQLFAPFVKAGSTLIS